MSNNIIFLSVFIFVASIITVIVLIAVAKGFKVLFLNNLSQEGNSFYSDLEEIKTVVESAKARLASGMLPYEKFYELEQAEIEFRNRINEIKEDTQTLNQTLKDLNKNLVEKEKKREELKSKSANVLLLIGELVANKTTLETEMGALQKELNSSKSMLITLESELELAEDQKAIFVELQNSLEELENQLFEVSTTYKDVSKSFMELENQYQSLEREYKRLIELNLKDKPHS
ncbi:MAG: hypothetical protein LBE20_01750 [Deltaproteobacteria bacterium]|jgi:chromosome segregation ATPase|nr:hypothetical protein [Deltaproteobacteria bacterium]